MKKYLIALSMILISGVGVALEGYESQWQILRGEQPELIIDKPEEIDELRDDSIFHVTLSWEDKGQTIKNLDHSKNSDEVYTWHEKREKNGSITYEIDVGLDPKDLPVQGQVYIQDRKNGRFLWKITLYADRRVLGRGLAIWSRSGVDDPRT